MKAQSGTCELFIAVQTKLLHFPISVPCWTSNDLQPFTHVLFRLCGHKSSVQFRLYTAIGSISLTITLSIYKSLLFGCFVLFHIVQNEVWDLP